MDARRAAAADAEYTLDPDIAGRVSWLRNQLLSWFQSNRRAFPWRQPGISRYQVIVAEILLQRTPATRASPVYNQFTLTFPDWLSLSAATIEDLQAILKPLGIWRRRAVVLLSLAKRVQDCSGNVPSSRQELESLPGVGQYVASAVRLSLGYSEPLLDVNMARVLERVFGPRKLSDIRYDPYLQTLARQTVASAKPGESLRINWAILDLGATICRHHSPLCSQCPLDPACRHHLAFRTDHAHTAPPGAESPISLE